MDIGALGFVNSIVSSSTNDSTKAGGSKGFAGVFTAIMQQTSGQVDVESNSTSNSDLTEKDLQDLLDFLNTEDLLDLDDGLALLDAAISSSDTNLLDVIKEYLGLSDEKLQKMLNSLNHAISNLKEADQNQSLITNDENEIDYNALLGLLQAISNLSMNEMKDLASKDFSEVLKVAKLLDLLLQHQDSLGRKSKSNEFLQQVTEKLEAMMQELKNVNRSEILQKAFTPVIAELNQRAVAKQVTSDNLSSNHTEDHSNPLPVSSNGQVHLQNMSRAEQLTLMLEKNGKPVSTEQLIQQFESILSKSSFLKSGGTQRLLLKLYPEHLGSLRIELLQKDANIIARILTSTGAAKEALDSQLHHLKQAFSSQNLQIERIEISQQMAQHERFLNKEGQGQQREEQEQKQQEHNKENEPDFNASFEEALLNMKV